MQISISDMPSEGWNDFVVGHPSHTLYHRMEWVLLPREVFGFKASFLEASDAGTGIRGVLPLVEQRSLLFGKYMTSLPFFNYGGALADSPQVAEALMEHARDLAIDSGCSYLEMRDVKSQPGDWQLRTDKVGMLRPLPESLELFSRQVGSKLRSQVKRADRERPEVAIGGVELLCDFHEVFSQNMRDVGTPALPRKFFKAVLERGGDECRIVAIRLGSIPVAAGFLITYGGRTEIPWAACRADAKPLGMNMKLYWEALSFAIRRGSRTFDFGRSTIGAGTFRFKQQWGASPVQLHWHRWERRPSGEGGAGKTASFLWKKLPMPLANVLSPLISPTLPW